MANKFAPTFHREEYASRCGTHALRREGYVSRREKHVSRREGHAFR